MVQLKWRKFAGYFKVWSFNNSATQIVVVDYTRHQSTLWQAIVLIFILDFNNTTVTKPEEQTPTNGFVFMQSVT